MLIATTLAVSTPTLVGVIIALAIGLLIGYIAGSMASSKSSRAPKKSGAKRDRSASSGQRRAEPRVRSGGDSGGGDGLVEIYVGNMSYDMDEEQMREMFSKFGTVASARLIDNRRNGKSKGYGFVEMPNRPEAEAAIKALNNKDVQGRKLRVNEARNKQRDDD